MKHSLGYILLIFLFYGCAQIVPPTGGERDKTPPHITRISVADSSVNFDANQIIIEFDEVIANKNLKEQILFSPFLKEDAKIKWQYDKVYIDISEDRLRPNTSYSLMLSEVADINEGNKLADTSILFSTGNFLDSLEIRGTLKSATGDADLSTMVAYLYSADDSIGIIKAERPRFYASISGTGKFHFQALPPGNYRVYALEDKNKNYRYDLSTEHIAFDTSLISLRSNVTLEDPLYSFVLIKDDGESEKSSSSRGGRTKNSAPSIKSTEFLKFSIDSSKKLTQSQDLYRPFTITVQKEIDSFDESLVSLTDTTVREMVSMNFQMDSTKKIINIQPKDGWQSDHVYRLYMKNAAIKDTSGKTNVTTAYFFGTKNQANYATAKFHFIPEDSTAQYILELNIDGTDSTFKMSPTSGYEINLAHLNPGKIKAKYFMDADQNGEYTNGSLEELKQPEVYRMVSEEYEIKESWDHVYSIKPEEENDSQSKNNLRSGSK